MVEGEGFYLSTARNSADFAGMALPQTAQGGPTERFRVNRRQRVPTVVHQPAIGAPTLL